MNTSQRRAGCLECCVLVTTPVRSWSVERKCEAATTLSHLGAVCKEGSKDSPFSPPSFPFAECLRCSVLIQALRWFLRLTGCAAPAKSTADSNGALSSCLRELLFCQLQPLQPLGRRRAGPSRSGPTPDSASLLPSFPSSLPPFLPCYMYLVIFIHS